jgi:anti-anti-sigma factor
MLKIQRSTKGIVVLTLSGRMDAENVAELEEMFRSEAQDCSIVLNLENLTLVDREAVRFLARCEAAGVRLENCPPYIRQWILSGGIGY